MLSSFELTEDFSIKMCQSAFCNLEYFIWLKMISLQMSEDLSKVCRNGSQSPWGNYSHFINQFVHLWNKVIFPFTLVVAGTSPYCISFFIILSFDFQIHLINNLSSIHYPFPCSSTLYCLVKIWIFLFWSFALCSII